MSNALKNDWQNKWLGLDAVSPVVQTMADEAERFCSRWFNNNREKTFLVLAGNSGTGKTHTANAIFKFCCKAAFSAFRTGKWGWSVPTISFISWPEAVSGFNEKRFGLIEDAIDADLTILDDIGSENDPWKIAADKLCQILSRRERKFTVITTNIAPASWNDKFDGRIADRLMRNSVIVDISSVPSYALK